MQKSNIKNKEPKLLITGSSGLIGSRLVELWQPQFTLIGIDRHPLPSNQIKNIQGDITDSEAITDIIQEIKPDYIVHLAAIADLEFCEKNKEVARKVNIQGTENLLKASKNLKIHYIYISTGFVFKGDQGNYKEDDLAEPQSYYAMTKYQGEELTKKLVNSWSIVRFNYPYRANFIAKTDCIRWMIPKFKNGEAITLVNDQYLKTAFVDKIGEVIAEVIRKKKSGIFHVADTSYGSWIDLARTVTEVFGFDANLIKEVSYNKYLSQTKRVTAPIDVSLNTEHTEKNLGIKMISLKQGLKEIKKQQEKIVST